MMRKKSHAFDSEKVGRYSMSQLISTCMVTRLEWITNWPGT